MNMTINTIRFSVIGLVMGLISVSLTAMGADLTIPKSWIDDETLTADDLNGNFQATKNAVDNNNDRISSNESGIGNHEIRITELESKHSSGIFSVSSLVGIPRNTNCITLQTSGTGYVGRYASTVCVSPEFLVVPVTLPDGATITAFRYTAYDVDATLDSEGILYRTDDTQVAKTTTTGEGGLNTFPTTVITNPLVDNNAYGYFVYMEINQTAGIAIVPVNAVVEYTLP